MTQRLISLIENDFIWETFSQIPGSYVKSSVLSGEKRFEINFEKKCSRPGLTPDAHPLDPEALILRYGMTTISL